MFFQARSGQLSQLSSFQNKGVNDAKKMIQCKQVIVLDVRISIDTASATFAKAKTINMSSPIFKKEVNK